jgi:glycosyltransferase involved in cell wall biosynthesis
MNIGIVTTWAETGAGHVSKAYETALEGEHNIYIYARGAHSAEKNPIWNKPNVTWAPYHPCSTGTFEKHFTRWVKRYSINTILFNEQRHWGTVVVARKLGILIGAYVDYYTADTVPFFNLYDFLICNTKRHYSVFKNHPQSCYCPWGTQVYLYQPKPSEKKRPITFLVSAGMSGGHARTQPWMDRKGTGLAMRVFQRVTGDCKLIVLSQIPLSDCPTEWQEAVDNDCRIEFLVGTFNPVPYELGDVYVYPSRLDGIGLSLPEALSCGLPAITTNCPPMNEFVEEGRNGMLLDVNELHGRPDGYYWPEAICNEDSLAEAFQYYVQHPEQAFSQGVNARLYAENKLFWGKNSAFLSEWVVKQSKLTEWPGIDFKFIESAALKYDRARNPTPLQSILLSIKSLLHYMTIRLTGKNK